VSKLWSFFDFFIDLIVNGDLGRFVCVPMTAAGVVLAVWGFRADKHPFGILGVVLACLSALLTISYICPPVIRAIRTDWGTPGHIKRLLLRAVFTVTFITGGISLAGGIVIASFGFYYHKHPLNVLGIVLSVFGVCLLLLTGSSEVRDWVRYWARESIGVDRIQSDKKRR